MVEVHGVKLALIALAIAPLVALAAADDGEGETITMAPLVVKGKVPVGNSGAELGVRGRSGRNDGLYPGEPESMRDKRN
jgi:hypothetical protein